jgi:lysophospholipase L1-like esterase
MAYKLLGRAAMKRSAFPDLRPYLGLTAIFCALATGCSRHGGAPEAHAEELPKTAKSSAPPKKSVDVENIPELADGVLTIWPVGDSITEGVEGGFRNGLYEHFTNRGIKVDYVGTLRDSSTRVPDQDHEGHPGFTIANARENLEEWLPKAEKADVVLVLLGTNDFAWWTNRGPESHLEELFGLLDDLTVKLPKAKILVATIPPQSSAVIETLKLDRQVLARKYDALLRASLPRRDGYGRRLFLIDLERVVEVSDLYDGIHPTGSAHRKIAQAWQKGIDQALGL